MTREVDRWTDWTRFYNLSSKNIFLRLYIEVSPLSPSVPVARFPGCGQQRARQREEVCDYVTDGTRFPIYIILYIFLMLYIEVRLMCHTVTAAGVGVLDDPAERIDLTAHPRRIRAAPIVGADALGGPRRTHRNPRRTPAHSLPAPHRVITV